MKIGGYTFGALLGLVAMIPVFAGIGYVVGAGSAKQAPSVQVD